jgi:inner membrane protein
MIDQLEQSKRWYQQPHSVLIKLSVIAVIILALIIPSAWIQDLISEREGYQHQIINGLNSEWAGPQLIQGPVLVIPYKKQVTEIGAGSKIPISHEVIKTLYLLPQNLQIKADAKTEPFKRGVYDATGYNAKILLQGNFNKPELNTLGVNPDDLLYDKARLVFSLSDLKGLKANPTINVNAQQYVSEPASEGNIPFDRALQVHFPLQKDQAFTFSYQLDLKGSNELTFLQLGKSTDVEMTSDWAEPDFSGHSLPDSRHVTTHGFNASWHRLYYNRPFPQQWLDDDSVLTNKKVRADAVFGVKLQLPIDQYRKVLRTTKYSTLIILLTFVSLFLTELIRKQRIHLFNYCLIGAAMVVYYTLLLSFSEQIGYNYAYLVSSVATIGLIAWFTSSLLKNGKAAGMFAFILSLFYGFIFIIIQLEELSLLVGSVALFIVVAALMFFSRKIDWDRH